MPREIHEGRVGARALYHMLAVWVDVCRAKRHPYSGSTIPISNRKLQITIHTYLVL